MREQILKYDEEAGRYEKQIKELEAQVTQLKGAAQSEGRRADEVFGAVLKYGRYDDSVCGDACRTLIFKLRGHNL